MAQLLRIPVLTKGLIPSTHKVTQLSTTLVPGDPMPPSELCRQTVGMHMVNRQIKYQLN